MIHKLKVRLALWCYRRGWTWLAYKLFPSIGWYVMGADFARTLRQIGEAYTALKAGYSSERPVLADNPKEGGT